MLRDETIRSIATQRAAVLRGGFKLIKLVLLKQNMNRVSAVENVVPVAVDDEGTGKKSYSYVRRFNKLIFEENDMEGETQAEIVDTPYNRKFLASMYTSKIWKIVDPDIDAEIRTQSEGVKDGIIKEIKGESESISDHPDSD